MTALALLLGVGAIVALQVGHFLGLFDEYDEEQEFTDWADWDWPIPEDGDWDFPERRDA